MTNIVVLIKQVPDTWSERKLTDGDFTLDREAADAVLDEINDRDNVVEFTRVPRNTSHCVPASAQNQLVSPLAARPYVASITPTYPDTGPARVRFPVPAVLVVSLHRSMTLWAMPISLYGESC